MKGRQKRGIPTNHETRVRGDRYSANDLRCGVRLDRRLFVLKRSGVSDRPARHQSFLEGFAYPSFLPGSVLCANFSVEWSPLNQQSVLRNRVLYYFLWINNIIPQGKGGLDFVKYGLVIELKSLNVGVQLSFRFRAWWRYFLCFLRNNNLICLKSFHSPRIGTVQSNVITRFKISRSLWMLSVSYRLRVPQRKPLIVIRNFSKKITIAVEYRHVIVMSMHKTLPIWKTINLLIP